LMKELGLNGSSLGSLVQAAADETSETSSDEGTQFITNDGTEGGATPEDPPSGETID